MAGVGRQLFVPLSLAVGFAMISSYVLSSTLVPVLSTWMLRAGHSAEPRFFERLYLAASLALMFILFPRIGTEVFPAVETKQLQFRPACADRHAAGAHRADRDEGDGRGQKSGRTEERRDHDRVYWCADTELSHQHHLPVRERSTRSGRGRVAET